jgi:hypothetical protein
MVGRKVGEDRGAETKECGGIRKGGHHESEDKLFVLPFRSGWPLSYTTRITQQILFFCDCWFLVIMVIEPRACAC